MSTVVATHMSDFVTLPTAAASAVLTVTTSAAALNLGTVGAQASTTLAATVGVPGHYVSFQADGGAVYIVSGPTQASVSAGNAPNPTTTGTNTAGNCLLIPAGSTYYAIPRPGVEQWIGYVAASGTATLRIFQSSY